LFRFAPGPPPSSAKYPNNTNKQCGLSTIHDHSYSQSLVGVSSPITGLGWTNSGRRRKWAFSGFVHGACPLTTPPPRDPNSSVVTRERSAHPVCSVIVWRLHPSEKKGAILTQWRARARSATLGCRVCSLSTGRTIHILTRHPCDCEQNCHTRSRATPRYAALHSGRGAMRKMGLF